MSAKSETDKTDKTVRTVSFPSTKSNVEGVKVQFNCLVCGRQWAIYLEESKTEQGLYKLPAGADVCIACAKRQNQEFKTIMQTLER